MWISTDDDELLCPRCGGNYLHHSKIDNYARHEDSPTCFHTTLDGNFNTTVVDGGKDNPSRRRDGLTIEFYCETCQSRPVLTIAQHKGQTLVKWSESLGRRNTED